MTLPDMLTVPKLLANLQKQFNSLLQENYTILDDFWYHLSNEDFSKKWEVAMWAQSIVVQMDETNKIQERDKSRFQVNLPLNTILCNMLIRKTERACGKPRSVCRETG